VRADLIFSYALARPLVFEAGTPIFSFRLGKARLQKPLPPRWRVV